MSRIFQHSLLADVEQSFRLYLFDTIAVITKQSSYTCTPYLVQLSCRNCVLLLHEAVYIANKLVLEMISIFFNTLPHTMNNSYIVGVFTNVENHIHQQNNYR